MAEALTSNQKSSFKSLNQKHYEERRRKDTLADSCKHHHGNPHHAGHYQLHGSVRKMTNENSTMWSGCSEIPNNHFLSNSFSLNMFGMTGDWHLPSQYAFGYPFCLFFFHQPSAFFPQPSSISPLPSAISPLPSFSIYRLIPV